MKSFWERTVVLPTGCIEWVGATVRGGYGQLRFGGKQVYAHRFAYELVNGPVPFGMKVLHRCDNPACVKPEHLTVGTQLENIADRQAKCRQARGERIAAAKLNNDAVRAIRSSQLPAAMLAAQYGVSAQTVREVKRNRLWSHIQ